MGDATDGRCPTCGEMFTPRRSDGRGRKQIYCSGSCRTVAANRALRDRNRPVRIAGCAECGGPVEHDVSAGRPRRFCSDACKARSHNRARRRSLPPLRDAAPGQKTCAHCGTEFTPKNRNRIYCYTAWCAQAAYEARKARGDERRMQERAVQCDGCGQVFTAKHPSARWCSKGCANRHWGNVRSRQRPVASPAGYTDREIFERDGWRCHLCGQPVERIGNRRNPDGATIDHVVPLSRGGTDEPENVATAHWRCNRDKGNRA